MTETDRPDGVIIATPNQVHVANGPEAVAARVPVIEKPIANDIAAAIDPNLNVSFVRMPFIGHGRLPAIEAVRNQKFTTQRWIVE